MPSLNCGKPREKKQRKRERRHTCAPRAALPRCAKSMITSWASFNQVFGQTWIMLIEAGRCWHLSDLSAALRDFNSAYVAYGSKPVKLGTSKCFPVCPQKRTLSCGCALYEYTP
jgi:hypothetical protein